MFADYVSSSTLAGDTSHKKGTVLARIVKGNIPVKNGVVHLIDRPLMLVASNVISYLQVSVYVTDVLVFIIVKSRCRASCSLYYAV